MRGLRRYRCVHCSFLVCGYCIGHAGHACGPGHAQKDCTDRQKLAAMTAEERREYHRTHRIQQLAALAAETAAEALTSGK